MMPSPPYPTKRVLLCSTTWRSCWEDQVTSGALARDCYHSNLWTGFSSVSFSAPPSEVFMGFVKSYIQMFAYGSVTSEQWKQYLFSYFKDKVRRSDCPLYRRGPCRLRRSPDLVLLSRWMC